MGTRLGVVALAGALVATGTVIGGWQGRQVGPPDEDRPGYPTIARVWVQNQGPNEAVPIVWSGQNSVPVLVETRQAVTVEAGPQTWEYRHLVVEAGRLVTELNALGQDGWEAITSMPHDRGIQVLLKRPE